MQKSIVRKSLVFLVIILFIGMSITTSTGSIEERKLIIVINSSGYIQDLIDDASPGDTIYIPSGTYYENIVIDKSIMLIGEDKETTIIDGSGIDHVILVNADLVNISGFTIQNGDNSGIYARVNYCNFFGNIIKNNERYGIYINISFEKYSHDNKISDNHIFNNHLGIFIGRKPSKNVNYTNNTICNNTIYSNHEGILLMRCQGDKVINNTIINNFNNIEIDLGKFNVIKNNEISSSVTGMFILDTNYNIITGNNFQNNSEYAIYMVVCSFHHIIDNNFLNNNHGIIMDSENCVISGNNISNNRGKGIFMDSCGSNNDISNNKFTNNYMGLHISYTRDTIIKDNIFLNDGLFIVSTKSNTYSNNIVNNKPLVFLTGESGRTLDHISAGQIILMNCNNIIVKNHDLSNTLVGIELISSSNCLVSNNVLNNNRYGLYITGSGNTVSRNHIKNSKNGICIIGSDNLISRNNINRNSVGIYWKGKSITVERNNFILNLRDARFHRDYDDTLRINWKRNYWGRPRILPKAIMGIKDIFRYYDEWGHVVVFPIPWIGLDLLPAKVPYIIL